MYNELFEQIVMPTRETNCPGVVGHLKADLSTKDVESLYTLVRSPNGSVVSELHNFLVAPPIAGVEDIDEFARSLTSFKEGDYHYRPGELFSETLQFPQLRFIEYAGSVSVGEQRSYGLYLSRESRYRLIQLTALHDPDLIEKVKGDDLDRESFKLKFYGVVPIVTLTDLLIARNPFGKS